MIYCLSLKTGRLSQEVDELLFWKAHEMIEGDKKYLFEKNDLFRAEIRTDFKKTMFGTVFGIIFEGDVEFEGKEVSIKYIIREGRPPRNEKLFWESRDITSEELKAPLN
jgi:hypothetical protein